MTRLLGKVLLVALLAYSNLLEASGDGNVDYEFKLETKVENREEDAYMSTDGMVCVFDSLADNWIAILQEFWYMRKNLGVRDMDRVKLDVGRLVIANHTTPERRIIMKISKEGERKVYVLEKECDESLTAASTSTNDGDATPVDGESTKKGEDQREPESGTKPVEPKPIKVESAREPISAVGIFTKPSTGAQVKVRTTGNGGLRKLNSEAPEGAESERNLQSDPHDRELGKKNKKKQKRRKWNANVKLGTTCGDLCPEDDNDSGRRVLTVAQETRRLQGDFESFMNENLTLMIRRQCDEARQKLVHTSFMFASFAPCDETQERCG